MTFTPLLLSLKVAGATVLLTLVLGLPLAYWLARTRSPLMNLLNALSNLPLVLPPVVLGYYLLVLFGYGSPLGRLLERLGLPLVFTWRGAVLAAWTVAFPLFLQSASAAFASVSVELEEVARTLGETEGGVFWRVTLPLAMPGILAGTLLAFARALGEFGATLMVAGDIPGQTQTAAIAIYDAVERGNQAQANIMAAVLTALAFAVLLVLRHISLRWGGTPRD